LDGRLKNKLSHWVFCDFLQKEEMGVLLEKLVKAKPRHVPKTSLHLGNTTNQSKNCSSNILMNFTEKASHALDMFQISQKFQKKNVPNHHTKLQLKNLPKKTTKSTKKGKTRAGKG